MPRHVKILAWIHVVLGGGLLLAASGLVAALLLDGPEARNAAPVVFWICFWLSVLLLIPSLAAGIGLLRNRRWARMLMLAISVEFLLVFPVGTMLGAYGLLTLGRQT